MTQETSSTDHQIETPETTEAATSDAQPAPAAALNRAQRRAKNQGKAAAGSAANAFGHAGAANPGASRSGGHAGQVRFPRTGHK